MSKKVTEEQVGGVFKEEEISEEDLEKGWIEEEEPKIETEKYSEQINAIKEDVTKLKSVILPAFKENIKTEISFEEKESNYSLIIDKMKQLKISIKELLSKDISSKDKSELEELNLELKTIEDQINVLFTDFKKSSKAEVKKEDKPAKPAKKAEVKAEEKTAKIEEFESQLKGVEAQIEYWEKRTQEEHGGNMKDYIEALKTELNQSKDKVNKIRSESAKMGLSNVVIKSDQLSKKIDEIIKEKTKLAKIKPAKPAKKPEVKAEPVKPVEKPEVKEKPAKPAKKAEVKTEEKPAKPAKKPEVKAEEKPAKKTEKKRGRPKGKDVGIDMIRETSLKRIMKIVNVEFSIIGKEDNNPFKKHLIPQMNQIVTDCAQIMRKLAIHRGKKVINLSDLSLLNFTTIGDTCFPCGKLEKISPIYNEKNIIRKTKYAESIEKENKSAPMSRKRKSEGFPSATLKRILSHESGLSVNEEVASHLSHFLTYIVEKWFELLIPKGESKKYRISYEKIKNLPLTNILIVND